MGNNDNNILVLNGIHYELSPSDWNLHRQILSRARVVNGNGCDSAPEKLTDSVVNRLIGHTNVLYYNCETNAWNTNAYNGYRMSDRSYDTKCVKEFKSAMEQIPEFNQHYEFVASVTMTIKKVFYNGWVQPVSNPEYSNTGTAVIGNIIVKNKQTGKYELYCKSWIGVCVSCYPNDAVFEGAYLFAIFGARSPISYKVLNAAHTR